VNIDDLPRRQSQLKDDVRAETALFEAGEISQKSYTSLVNEAYRENQQLETTLKNLEWGRGMVAAQEAAFTDGLQTKAMGVGPNRLPSPMDLTETQLKALWMAAKARTPFNVEIGQKGGLEQAWASQITTKSPPSNRALVAASVANCRPCKHNSGRDRIRKHADRSVAAGCGDARALGDVFDAYGQCF
jgi:hypothetical protein